MAKNIYSLVLNDEIIEMIDNVAYKKGVSRSTLVNSVLAEYVGYETPKKRLENLFNLVEDIVAGQARMRIEPARSENAFSIVSALNFKYSPRISYVVEFFGGEDMLGELNILYRTSNAYLIELITSFFSEFIALEKLTFGGNVLYYVSEGKLKRTLKNWGYKNSQDMANAIVGYVSMVDKLLNAYVNDNQSDRSALLKARYNQANKILI